MDQATSYGSAIKRQGPSAPVKYLDRHGLLAGAVVLDYGCGWGADVLWMNRVGLCAEGYDPDPAKGYNRIPKRKYRVILCTYVLNTLDRVAGQDVLDSIMQNHLHKGSGRLYVTVRRDVNPGSLTQRQVYLDAEIVNETRNFCIYCIKIKK
jgi:ATP adenylyltransferase